MSKKPSKIDILLIKTLNECLKRLGLKKKH